MSGFITINAQNLKTDMEKVSYSLGVNIATSLKQQGWELDAKTLATAISDVINGNELAISEQEANTILQSYQQKLMNKTLEANSEAGKAFLEENAKREEVTTTASGLQYEVLEEGEGDSPKATDEVEVHYHGTVIGLGLKKMHHTVELQNTPEVRGMINAVNFLLKVES